MCRLNCKTSVLYVILLDLTSLHHCCSALCSLYHGHGEFFRRLPTLDSSLNTIGIVSREGEAITESVPTHRFSGGQFNREKKKSNMLRCANISVKSGAWPYRPISQSYDGLCRARPQCSAELIWEVASSDPHVSFLALFERHSRVHT